MTTSTRARPDIAVVTLGVADLDRSVRFYGEGLGFTRFEKPGVAYFALEGTWLGLFPREALAKYVGVPAEGGGFCGVTLSHNAASREDVDALVARAAAAGGRVVRPPEDLPWGGYGGWFADPDGFLWEVCWNPRPFIPGT